MPRKQSRHDSNVVSADGIFLPVLHDHGAKTAQALEDAYFDAVAGLLAERELGTEPGRQFAASQRRYASLLTPRWLRSAEDRGLVVLSPPEATGRRVGITDLGREALDSIEFQWSLLDLRHVKQGSRALLRGVGALALALATGTLITATAALQALRENAVTWLILVIFLAALGFLVVERWRSVRRVHQAFSHYWLYRGDRRRFFRERAKGSGTRLAGMQDYVARIDRRVTTDLHVMEQELANMLATEESSVDQADFVEKGAANQAQGSGDGPSPSRAGEDS